MPLWALICSGQDFNQFRPRRRGARRATGGYGGTGSLPPLLDDEGTGFFRRSPLRSPGSAPGNAVGQQGNAEMSLGTNLPSK